MQPILLLLATPLFAGMMQAPSTPPIKMGLWEITTVARVSGPNAPANMPPRTITIDACRTLETYQDFFTTAGQHGCARSNETWTSGSYTADISCAGGRNSGHVEVFFDSPEATHSVVHFGSASTMQVESTSKGRYLGASCGALPPGKAEAVQIQ